MSTYQSVSTLAWAATATPTITKPTGLAVGDFMVAVLCNVAGVTTNFSTPSGWTAYGNETQNYSGGEIRSVIFTKVADSSDVAASNFAFTQGSSQRVAGAIIRLDNYGYIDQTAVTKFANQASGSITLTPITGVTPTKINSLLLLLAFGAESSGTDPVFATYSIATSNPSWTEIYELADGTATGTMSCAVATRPEITATGNASITLSNGPTNGDYITRIISITPKVSGSATPDAIENVYFRVPPHIQPIKNVSFAIPESTSTSRDKLLWTNEIKPSTTWTNETL